MISNIQQILCDLEKTELSSSDGAVSPHVYSQMLAIYLYQNELYYAKYLWKRIPERLKNNNEEIRNLWNVAKSIWLRDWPGVHEALNVNWNEHVAYIMNALKARIQEDLTLLISKAYSSIDINALSDTIGFSSEELQQVAQTNEWDIIENMVEPRKILKQQNFCVQEGITEDQLSKLTRFVSFLEN